MTAVFAADVRKGLARSRKKLPPKYFYDSLGSHLFEAITQLPWYPVTVSEMKLLKARGPELIELTSPSVIVELGAGSGEKFKTLVQILKHPLTLHLVDISAKALDFAERTLGTLSRLKIVYHHATFEAGLRAVSRHREKSTPLLLLLLGSTFGNLEPPARRQFVGLVATLLRPGDYFLLGVDLVKPRSVLLAAYDDPLGVTAAFNMNLLVRINRELGGNFDLTGFGHLAVWNRKAARVEMHLRSRRRQSVQITEAACTVQFKKGETIWTESSYKYHPASLRRIGERVGLRCMQQWTDAEGQFALTLLQKAGS